MGCRTLLRVAVVAALAALVAAPAASAHVTLNPREWEAGGFARFAVRVPNERPNAATVEVTVQFPENVISASFQPVPGWKRTVTMVKLDVPIEGEDGQITERIDSVTWSGGRIEPGEFQEFGLSFRVPEDAAGTTLVFPSLQTYSGGEIVRWIGDEESEEPAPTVAVLEAASEDEHGLSGGTDTTMEEEDGETTPEGTGVGTSSAFEDDDDGLATVALVLGIAGLVAGLAALGVALGNRRRST
jgi:uncharacterized protein YcnI